MIHNPMFSKFSMSMCYDIIIPVFHMCVPCFTDKNEDFDRTNEPSFNMINA